MAELGKMAWVMNFKSEFNKSHISCLMTNLKEVKENDEKRMGDKQ